MQRARKSFTTELFALGSWSRIFKESGQMREKNDQRLKKIHLGDRDNEKEPATQRMSSIHLFRTKEAEGCLEQGKSTVLLCY